MKSDVGFPNRPESVVAEPPASRSRTTLWLAGALVAALAWHWHSASEADDRTEKICSALASYTAAASERVPPPPDLSKADDRYKDIDAFYRAEMWDEYRFMSSDDPAARRLTLTRASLTEIDRACGVVR